MKMFRRNILSAASAMKMEAVYSSEMLISSYKSTRWLQPRRPTSTL
jgi:hypothetical protein